MDRDSLPCGHELDNHRGKRKCRIEYKHPDERPDEYGTNLHYRAELESTRAEWKYLMVLVVDEGQTNLDDKVRCRMRWNTESAMEWQDEMVVSLRELGGLIARRIWP